MKIIKITQIASLVGGVLLAYYGFRMRKSKKNWFVIVAGGIAIFAFSLLGLLGIISIE